MGAPIGNTNAEKWSLEESTKLLDRLLKAANDKDYYQIGTGINASMIEGYKFDFIGELSLEFEVYHHLITRDIPKRFPELRPTVDLLISLMERNCYSNTKKGIINTAVGIVNLKSNHKWTDRVSNDLTTGGDKINIPISSWANEE
jgi:hypothetical protein